MIEEGVYKVHLFIKSVGEEYQVVRGGILYTYVGKNITLKKRERESNFILPILLRLVGRISSGKEERQRKLRGRKKDWKKNNGMGKNIKL